MVKYICSVDRGTVISYDKEVENVSLLNHFYVDYTWYIPEDREWIYTLYPIDKESDAEYIFIENDEVKNHYNRLLEKGQEEKKKATSCDIDCDCGCDCGCDCETVKRDC